jgi:hypothetical protein
VIAESNVRPSPDQCFELFSVDIVHLVVVSLLKLASGVALEHLVDLANLLLLFVFLLH